MKVDISHEDRVSIWRVSGCRSNEDWLKLLIDTPKNPGPFLLLVFGEDCSLQDLGPENIRTLVARNRERHAPEQMGALAAVVTDDLNFGLSRMFISLREGSGFLINSNVFRTEEEARTWLNSL